MDKEVKIHVTTDPIMDFRGKNFAYKVIGFHELIRRAARSSQEQVQNSFIHPDELYYLRALGSDPRGRETVLLEKDFPQLAADFKLPDLFDPERLFSSVLRVSSPGIRVWTHYDVLDNVYVQVVGRKRAILWSPSQANNMYLDGDKSKVLDVECQSPETIEMFPKFVNAPKMEVDLEPGDILFIPSMWFHNMTAVDFGVAVNVFWKNLDPELYDKKDPYGNRDLIPGAKALRMMDNVIRQLDDLPKELKDFYGRQIINKVTKKCLNDENND